MKNIKKIDQIDFKQRIKMYYFPFLLSLLFYIIVGIVFFPFAGKNVVFTYLSSVMVSTLFFFPLSIITAFLFIVATSFLFQNIEGRFLKKESNNYLLKERIILYIFLIHIYFLINILIIKLILPQGILSFH